jgi:DNA polymerase III epsilon subunit-like protein
VVVLTTSSVPSCRKQAEIDLNRTRAEVSRVGGDANKLDTVKNARDQLASAQEGVTQAVKSVEQAKRGIDSAKRAAKDATADTFAASYALDYMLKQLSPAERRLYQSIERIQKTYRQNFRLTSSLAASHVRLMARTRC